MHFQTEITKSKSNSKKLWKTLNNIANFKKPKFSDNIILTDDNGAPMDNQQVGNYFNDYFTSIGPKIHSQCSRSSLPHNSLLNNNIKKSINSLYLSPISKYDIINFISELDTNKSTKSDCASAKFIKLSSEIISPIIADILNQCVSEGIFPDELKKAEVIPVYKKGDKSKTCNYRPISLLSIFSKIFEKYLYNQINNFINKNNLLYKYQYGFQKKLSTDIALAQICENLSNKMDSDKITCSVFLDLQKAFDTVDHAILLQKLYSYGIRGIAAKLLHSYLSNRQQVCIVNGQKSSSKQIICGVPQGSILGPLLFLLFINDLPEVCNFEVRLFADDACLIYSDVNPTNLQINVNNELARVDEWMKTNKLSINYSKSNYIIFTRKKSQTNYNIDIQGNRLQRVSQTKYLGVIINEKLKWNDHVDYISKKISKGCYIISKIRYFVQKFTLRMLYFSLIQSHLNYCIATWGGAPKSTLNQLIVLQKKVIRIITYSSYDARSEPLFDHLKILNVNKLYQLNLSKIIYKLHHNLTVSSENLIPISQIHTHQTRLSQSNNYFQNFNRSNLGLATYTNNGLKIWRNIPPEIKSLPFHTFKFKIKQLLFDNEI